MLDVDTARTLGQRMWQQIERRRMTSNHDQQMPAGIRGCLDYYRGFHNLRFTSEKFAEHFKTRFNGFSDNWCASVVDAAAERMNFVGLRLDSDTNEGDDATDQDNREADADFQRVMEANDVPSGMSEAFTVALACGRSFALVWGDPDDEQTPMVSFEHPEFCTLAIDPATRRPTAAAKGWMDGLDGFLNLYTADEVWKWQWSVSDRDKADPRKQPAWVPRQGTDDTWPMKNPMGRVPMVEFRNQTLLDDLPLSDLSGVAAMQDAINLVWAYLFNGLDFASLPQRVVTGSDVPKVPVLDESGQIIGEKPVDLKALMNDRILWLTNKDASPHSWPAANLDVFGKVIEMAVDHIASQTRTPPHYLMGKMSNTAAESLTVAETGLVAKVIQRQQYFTRPIRELHRLVALAQNDAAKAKQAATGVVVWKNPQYRSLAQQTDAFVKLRQAGMPLRWMVEWLGLSPAEVQRVMEMAEHEADVLVAPTPLKAPPGAILPRGYSELTGMPSANGSAAPNEERAAADMPGPN